MTNLAVWVKFETEEDAIKATDILFRAGESYSGNKHHWTLVSRNAIRMFEEQGVRFTPIAKAKQSTKKKRAA